MIDNYEKVHPGHWHQIEGEPIKYDYQYIAPYTKMGDKMSALRYNLVSKHTDFHSVLDFGYGSGDFLQYCWYKSKFCYGHDISNFAVPRGTTFVEDVMSKEYDLVCFFDSLEHLPQKDLGFFLSALETEYVCISLPWFHESLGPLWFETWKHRKPNEHFHHFNEVGLSSLLEESGYRILHVSNAEDAIRKPVDQYPNIMTMIAKKYA